MDSENKNQFLNTPRVAPCVSSTNAAQGTNILYCDSLSCSLPRRSTVMVQPRPLHQDLCEQQTAPCEVPGTPDQGKHVLQVLRAEFTFTIVFNTDLSICPLLPSLLLPSFPPPSFPPPSFPPPTFPFPSLSPSSYLSLPPCLSTIPVKDPCPN